MMNKYFFKKEIKNDLTILRYKRALTVSSVK